MGADTTLARREPIHAIAALDPKTEQQRLRQALAQYGTGVTVVTTADGDGHFGVTSNSFSSVSLDPPLVLWSIKKTSQSYDAFMRARHFAVNVLAAGQRDISSNFAKSGGDKFAGIAFEPGLGGCPLIDGAAARFECETWSLYEGGDHTIIVGEVKTFASDDVETLLFCRGQYARAAASVLPSVAADRKTGSQPGSGEFLTTLLRNVHGAMWRKMEAGRREIGVSHAQSAIMYALRQQPGLSADALPAQLGFGLNLTDDELQQLIAEGRIEQTGEGGLALTSSGQQLYDEFLLKMRDVETAVFGSYAPDDLEIVRRVLLDVISRAEA